MPDASQFAGRAIPDPGFAGDTGMADAALERALAGYARDPGRYPEALHALSRARVFVPVVAVAGDTGTTVSGLAHDKSADMAVVTLVGADGRTALAAFSSVARLAAWRAEARPVPVEAQRAALSALGEQADALVLDPIGAVAFTVEGTELRALAQGAVSMALYDDEAVAALVRESAAGESDVTATRLEPWPGCDARVIVGVRGASVAPDLARRMGERLGAVPELRRRVLRGLDVAFEPDVTDGSGRPLR